MSEHDFEPIRGLPGQLPPGERIIWQGAPQWRPFLRHALLSRWIAGYFGVLGLVAVASGSISGAIATIVSGLIAQGLLAAFAILVARTSVYTLTDRRLVLRIGVALSACINLPLALIGSVDLREQGEGSGDIALTLIGRHRLGYAALWPHVRPLGLTAPRPMLRALPDVAHVGALLAQACAALPGTRIAPADVSGVRQPLHGVAA